MMDKQLPEVLAGLWQRLEAAGFSVNAEPPLPSFGDRVITFVQAPLAIRLISDRGQWFIAMTRPAWHDWFDADLWQACLDNETGEQPGTSLADQATFVTNNLDRLAAAAEGTSSAGLLQLLKQRRAAGAKRRLGIPHD